MPKVIAVKFAYSAHDLWFDPVQSGAAMADHVVCHTERGLEIGLCVTDVFEVSSEELASTIGEDKSLKSIERVAQESDLERARELADKADYAFGLFAHFVSEEELDMKPVGCEYLFDGSKVVFYFCADERIDFRQLVRDLSHELHERIDMRQIGVREEAALVGGFAHCGQELCCARLGHQFEPVSIRMAKEQDLPLNSAKISGACGRLMCCLRYEFEAYRDFKQRAPKRNALIDTPLGTAKIVEYNTPKEQLILRLENGKQLAVPLAEMHCSEAATKKAKTAGCACRPDSVTREALERLDSVDVQMALAELDRAAEEGAFDEDAGGLNSDIFVNAKGAQTSFGKGASKSRGSKGASKGFKSSSAEHDAIEPSAGKVKSDAKGNARNDARGATTGATTGDSANTSASLGRKPRNSRRSGSQGGGLDAATAAHLAPASRSTRRRRHHSAAGEGLNGVSGSAAGDSGTKTLRNAPTGRDASLAGTGAGTGADLPNHQAKSSSSKTGAPVRRRRRPGDHGGDLGALSDTLPQLEQKARAKRTRRKGDSGDVSS